MSFMWIVTWGNRWYLACKFFKPADEELTLKWTINRKWLGSCIIEGTVVKSTNHKHVSTTCEYLRLEFSGCPWTLHWLGIKPQHFSLLTCLTLVCGLKWMVRSLALDWSIRQYKHIFNYKANKALHVRVLHFTKPDGVVSVLTMPENSVGGGFSGEHFYLQRWF